MEVNFGPYLGRQSLKCSNSAFLELQHWFLPKNWSEFHQKLIGTVISDPRTAKCDM